MIRIIFVPALIVLVSLLVFSSNAQSLIKPNDKGRLIVLADMGNEPDEEQQMFHLFMCSNEIDIEGLIAVTGKFLNPNSNDPAKKKLYPELFHRLIEGYSKVYKNLLLHSSTYPAPQYLDSIVFTGQRGYGMNDVGIGKSSDGSNRIINVVLKKDPRPVYVVVNAGSNTLAQAMFDYSATHNANDIENFVSKLIVFENGAQDDAGSWICKKFPSIKWIRSNYQTYCYGGPSIDGGYDNKGKSNELGPYTWKPFAYNGTGQHQWLLENVIGNHGAFGNYYPLRQFKNGGISFMEGGGTIPWLCLVNKGLSDIENPWWGGWSGRYSREKQKDVWSKHESVKKDELQNSPFYLYTEVPDTWYDEIDSTQYTNNLFAPVWRWRRAFLNDFVCRMDWCVQPFEKANHHPVAVVNGDSSNSIIVMNVKPNQKILFDGSASYDPDGNKIFFSWWNYKEAGTFEKDVLIENKNSSNIELTIPNDSSGKEIHIILEIRDDSKIAQLYDYRRIVLKVL